MIDAPFFSSSSGTAATPKRSSTRLKDPDLVAKHKAFMQKVSAATNGSMDSYLKQESASADPSTAAAVTVVEASATASATAAQAQGPTTAATVAAAPSLKRKANSVLAASHGHQSSKRRRSNRTNSVGTVRT